jgi:uncharacterized membrane protein YhdT
MVGLIVPTIEGPELFNEWYILIAIILSLLFYGLINRIMKYIVVLLY